LVVKDEASQKTSDRDLVLCRRNQFFWFAGSLPMAIIDTWKVLLFNKMAIEENNLQSSYQFSFEKKRNQNN